MIQYPRYRQHRFSSFQVIIAGFAAVDLVGALLLMLPIAAQQRCVTPFHEALFTSTSALCVTGLVVQDTGSYWSVFGQSVILLLIQIGGLGVITVGAAFALLSGRKISLKQRSTMQEATAAPQMGGIVRLTHQHIAYCLGYFAASLLFFRRLQLYGVSTRRIWKSWNLREQFFLLRNWKKHQKTVLF